MSNIKGGLEPQAGMGRRQLLRTGGYGLAATGTFLFGSSFSKVMAQDADGASKGDMDWKKDTANQILLAALIAEDLASTFYYYALKGKVMEDPNLAGPGGTVTMASAGGNQGNVDYIRAALTQEIQHADLLRAVLGRPSSPAGDPYQYFYLPQGSFDTLKAFTGLLDALESAFIGAYLNATREFASLAARCGERGEKDGPYGGPYSSRQLEYFAEVAASIMGVEAEHRVLGRVISNMNPANNWTYEQTDGLTSVYNGPHSAVGALKPFLAPGPGLIQYCLEEALAGQSSVSLPSTGNPPPMV